jgi:hypothetical protein
MIVLLSRVLTVNNLGWIDFYISLIIIIIIGCLLLSIED